MSTATDYNTALDQAFDSMIRPLNNAARVCALLERRDLSQQLAALIGQLLQARENAKVKEDNR